MHSFDLKLKNNPPYHVGGRTSRKQGNFKGVSYLYKFHFTVESEMVFGNLEIRWQSFYI